MKTALKQRGPIPFYEDKSAQAFRLDPYEHYEGMVLRQTYLHLADELWGSYPLQPALDWLHHHLPTAPRLQIADIGCSVGRLIGELALARPDSDCWGIDYSYQMLRQAWRYWCSGQALALRTSDRGWPALRLQGPLLRNLDLGLAKAATLPFESNSLDLLCNSFLIDRLPEPQAAFAEWHRVLKAGGKLLIISPLNFQQAAHWAEYHPPERLLHHLTQLGFTLLESKAHFLIKEPLDVRGNCIHWDAIGLALQKGEA
ncbi:MAG: methyltransferase domain-containing protein [Bacteroidota bacterium]